MLLIVIVRTFVIEVVEVVIESANESWLCTCQAKHCAALFHKSLGEGLGARDC